MALTYSEIAALVVLVFIGIFISACIGSVNDSWIICAVGAIATLVIVAGMGFFMNWKNTCTASGIRAYKDYKSEMTNGIDREITITAEDGREIFHYEGKVDVESNHTDNYIKFESEDGKRYIIYYGVQDTIQIIEK